MSKSDNHWYPRYVGDYQSKTSHLSLIEHGAYALLMDHYYSTGKPLPANASVLHRICRAITPEEVAAVNFVIETFFQCEEDGYHNQRADKELLKRGEIKEKRRNAANSRHANAPALAPVLYREKDANAYTATATSTIKKLATAEKTFEEKEISSAKRGTPAWTPNFITCEVLPGGWADAAELLGIPDGQTYTSWRKFKDQTGSPYELNRWKGWIKNEKGAAAKPQLEAAQ